MLCFISMKSQQHDLAREDDLSKKSMLLTKKIHFSRVLNERGKLSKRRFHRHHFLSARRLSFSIIII